MTSADLWASWRLWMLVATVIIAVAAALLVTIWLTARSIAAHATRALKAAEAIRDNTRVIWQLQTTNEGAEQIRDTVCAIESNATKLIDALQEARRHLHGDFVDAVVNLDLRRDFLPVQDLVGRHLRCSVLSPGG